MADEADREVRVTFAEGVREDIASLTATSDEVYRNEPSDGAPAECRWLAVAPRAGLHAHRRAQQRL
jgi:hypothetical protein